MHRLRLAGCFLCCVVHVYGGHLRCKKNYPKTGKGQEEIGWIPSHVEAVCDEHSQLGTEGWTSSVCLVNILTATNRTLQCASFFQILCCVCSEDTWVISKVLHNVLFLFKNEFILQSTFTGLQCNLHCALSQRSVWASLVFLSGRLCCWCIWLLGSPPQCFWSVSHGVVSSILGTSQRLVGSCQNCTAGGEALANHTFPKFPILHPRHEAAR